MALQSSLKNLVLVLGGVGLVSALALGGFSVLTKASIAQAKQQKIIASLKQVLPPFDNDPSQGIDTIQLEEGTLLVYQAKQGDALVGKAVQSFSPNGFGGKIVVMVGFDAQGAITGYSVLEHAETPGLGSHMVDWFKPQGEPTVSLVEKLFRFTMPVKERHSNVYGLRPGEQTLQVSKDGGQIDAITAATISSRAFLDAVNRAYKGFELDADVATGATSQAK